MTSSLVGSEMCIRDSTWKQIMEDETRCFSCHVTNEIKLLVERQGDHPLRCLLYTSDAADDM
eukprot:2339785-Prorocentrum_lima.AAC.1